MTKRESEALKDVRDTKGIKVESTDDKIIIAMPKEIPYRILEQGIGEEQEEEP
jgi:hypothetical protein